MTVWDFVAKNTDIIIIVIAILVYLFLFILKKSKKVSIGSLTIEGQETSQALPAGVKCFTEEAMILENNTLRGITRKIADLEDRTLLRKQMAIMEEVVEELIVLENADFREFLFERKINGQTYDNSIHDNDRVMSETKKMMTTMFRLYMRQNGFQKLSEASFKEYVAKRYKSLYEKCDQLRVQVSANETLVAHDYINWCKTIDLKKYYSRIEDGLHRCKDIAQQIYDEVNCLHEDYKRIESEFILTGKVGKPTLSCDIED